jgi:hypothetical protein
MVRVTVTREGEPDQTLSFEKADVLVGRGAEADIQLSSGAVSRRHARLLRTDAGWQVTDLGSANGVFTSRSGKAERITLAQVEAGDAVLIADYELLLDDAQAPAPAARAPRPVDDARRTQFIVMEEILAARERARQATRPPGISGPMLRAPGPTAPRADTAPWRVEVRLESGGAQRFTFATPRARVGAGESCEVRLPSGPEVAFELARAGARFELVRRCEWPLPRIEVAGEAVERATLAPGTEVRMGRVIVRVDDDGGADD